MVHAQIFLYSRSYTPHNVIINALRSLVPRPFEGEGKKRPGNDIAQHTGPAGGIIFPILADDKPRRARQPIETV